MKLYRYHALSQFVDSSISSEISIVKHFIAKNEPLHKHDYFEIVYVCEGSGLHVINDKAYKVKAGNIMLLTPDDSHAYYSLNDMSIYNCCFIHEKLPHYFPKDHAESPVIALSPYYQLQIEQLLHMLETELSDKRQQYMEVSWQLLDLILLNIQRNISQPVFETSYWAPLLAKIATSGSSLTLAEAAELMGISTRHFCRVFKQKFKCTFGEYLNNIHLQQAKHYLQFSKISIQEAGRLSGYKNAESFFSNFKKATGMTPLQYRKKMQDDKAAAP